MVCTEIEGSKACIYCTVRSALNAQKFDVRPVGTGSFIVARFSRTVRPGLSVYGLFIGTKFEEEVRPIYCCCTACSLARISREVYGLLVLYICICFAQKKKSVLAGLLSTKFSRLCEEVCRWR